MKKYFWIIFACITLGLSSCSTKDDEPAHGSENVVDPNQSVPDPTGTIELSMRNNGETSLNNLIINGSDNFTGNGWSIASIGKVKGLGNVYTIPIDGWAAQMSVTPGNGYVAYDRYSDEFYRIYVMDYILSATTEGVIGANIKYQKPFKGVDEQITFDKTTIVLPSEGGSEQVIFNNSSIIPFKVTCSEDWCHVRKASTRDENFLYDAVVVSCDETYVAESSTAIVTITTLYGKESSFTVTRSGRGEFITASNEEVNVGLKLTDSEYSVRIFTNVEPKDIKITSDQDWLDGRLSAGIYAPDRSVKWIEDKPATRATLENPIYKDLILSVTGYGGSENRSGNLTLSYGNVNTVIKVTQEGSKFSMSKTDFKFEGEDNLSQSATWTGNLNYEYLYADIEREKYNWIWVDFNYGTMIVSLSPNPYVQSRDADIDIYYRNNEISQQLATIHIVQDGTVATDRYVYFESNASNYTLSFPLPQNAKIISDAEWCSATPNNSTLIIRATATTEDRAAVIEVEGVDSKIYVSQSKYKVGDTYQLGDVEARVYSMDNGVGRIVHYLNNKGNYISASWSNENIFIEGVDNETDGRVNTEIIKKIPGWRDLYPAFAVVDELNKDGITGWYLPAVSEFNNRNYWSSTQYSATHAYRCDKQYYFNKTDQCRIVGMNTFSYDFSNRKSEKKMIKYF